MPARARPLGGGKGHACRHRAAAGYRRAGANAIPELHTLAHRCVEVRADHIPPVACVPFETANVGDGMLAREQSREPGGALRGSIGIGLDALLRLAVEKPLLPGSRFDTWRC